MTREIRLLPHETDYRFYDRNRSGGLDARELERATHTEIATLIEARLASRRWAHEDAAGWLLDLSPAKAARVLGFMDEGLAPVLFEHAYLESPAKALRILLFGREPFSDPSACRGREVAGWLQNLTASERWSAIWMLSSWDVGHALDIWGQAAAEQALRCMESQQEEVEEVGLAPLPAEARPERAVREQVARGRTVVIPMRGYAVGAVDTRQTLLTADVSTCTVVSFYDPVRRVGALAHFDVLSDHHNSLDRIFADLRDRGIHPGSLEARIVGGNRSLLSSRGLTGDLETRLRLEGVRILEVERTSNGAGSRAFALDLRTGNFEDYRGAYLESDRTRRDPHHPSLLARAGRQGGLR